jgi:hypothetical protein
MAVDELAMLALGVPFGRPPPPGPDAAALVERREDLAAVLQGGPPAPGLPRVIPLPAYPRTRAAVELLASAVG